MSCEIALQGVTFRYREEPLFEEFCMRVPPGEVWGLVGRSGVGKSTLIHIVLGLFRPEKGRVTVDGETVNDPGQIRGVLFQDDTLLPWLTAEENVRFCSRSPNDDDDRALALKLLSDLGLVDVADSHPGTLSGGMRRRVEVARALFSDEHFFVADEPFSALDAVTRGQVWALWRNLRRTYSRTGIICTHDPLEAAVLSDKVIVLAKKPGDVVMPRVLDVPRDLREGNFEDAPLMLHEFRAKLMALL